LFVPFWAKLQESASNLETTVKIRGEKQKVRRQLRPPCDRQSNASRAVFRQRSEEYRSIEGNGHRKKDTILTGLNQPIPVPRPENW
jgi:hypothetical protein